MATEKVTVMILYVDLKCTCCYKKVRKLLCKFPQIRDQVFDEDKNKVTITVICCDPEKFRDKLCCKGGKAIQSIEIFEPKQPPPPTTKPVVVEKPKEPSPPPVPVPKPVVVEKPKQDPPPPPKQLEKKPSGKPKPPPVVTPPPPVEKPKPPPPAADPPKQPPPVVVVPQPQPVKMPDPIPQPQPVKMPDPTPMPMPMPMEEYHPQPPFCPPVSVCCQECYEGRGGGPCHYEYGRPVPPPPGPCYDPAYYGYQYPFAGNRPCYATRCDYFSEDNPQGCSIM